MLIILQLQFPMTYNSFMITEYILKLTWPQPFPLAHDYFTKLPTLINKPTAHINNPLHSAPPHPWLSQSSHFSHPSLTLSVKMLLVSYLLIYNSYFHLLSSVSHSLPSVVSPCLVLYALLYYLATYAACYRVNNDPHIG